MKASDVRDRSQIGLIDYTLVGLGSTLAVYSAGMAVSEPSIALFSGSVVLAGTLFSYLLRVLLGRTSFVTVDGIVYGGAILLAIILLPRLNTLLPANGYPREVIMASALSWMLMLGSFCAWRDGTLLFQAIPAIALFGLVGCYDTFRSVIYAFFGFLLCLATLFARAHTREMLQQAVDSGWFNRADSPGRSTAVQRSMALYERIKEGPWRWLAGPEWALASALAVILVSMVGAPVIRESVREVSGSVKLPAPPIKSQLPPVVGSPSTNQAPVGRGPLAPLSETPLYETRLDQLRYLRGAVYDIYEGNSWRTSQELATNSFFPGLDRERRQNDATFQEIRRPVEFSWVIRPLLPTSLIPMPGEVIAMDGVRRRRSSIDTFGSTRRGLQTVRGTSVEADPSVQPASAVAQLPTYLLETTSLAGVPESVKKLARDTTQGAKSDYERALKIKREIGRRCLYNLRAPAIPADRDAAEHFLFTQREGYCDLFATSMVVMARSVGIPARYTTGFLPGTERKTGDTYIVVQADAHAWAELFFEGVGWVVFDPTEDAQQAPDGARGQATVGPPWYQSAWFKTALDMIIVVGVVAAGLLYWKSTKSAKISNPNRQRLERLFVQFIKVLERRARTRRQLSETPDEFLQAVLPKLNGSAQTAKEINNRFVRGLFSPEPLSDEGLAQLGSDLRNFEKMLRKEPVAKQ